MRIFPPQRARAVTGMLAVAACALLLTGCAQPDPVVTPHATSTVKPLFASDADALAAATKAYAAFTALSDQIMADGGQNPERIRSVATKHVADQEIDGYSQFAKLRYRSVGTSKVDSQKLEQYDPRGAGRVTIYLCVDASGVDVVDESGESVVSESRPSRTPFEVSFVPKAPRSSDLIVASKKVWAGAGIC